MHDGTPAQDDGPIELTWWMLSAERPFVLDEPLMIPEGHAVLILVSPLEEVRKVTDGKARMMRISAHWGKKK